MLYSCYLIKHGNEYMLWDTGHSMTAPNVAPKVSVIDRLAKIEVKPDQIEYVGISHYHADHTGQVDSFPKATLLIGAREWEAITSPKPAQGVNFKPFEGWIRGENKAEPVCDRDRAAAQYVGKGQLPDTCSAANCVASDRRVGTAEHRRRGWAERSPALWPGAAGVELSP
jgi:metal-dependent hydrolase (beta-lactamase superfamily II)